MLWDFHLFDPPCLQKVFLHTTLQWSNAGSSSEELHRAHQQESHLVRYTATQIMVIWRSLRLFRWNTVPIDLPTSYHFISTSFEALTVHCGGCIWLYIWGPNIKVSNLFRHKMLFKRHQLLRKYAVAIYYICKCNRYYLLLRQNWLESKARRLNLITSHFEINEAYFYYLQTSLPDGKLEAFLHPSI